MRADRRELRRRLGNGLFAVAVRMTDEAKRLATRHVDSGTRRNSITQTRTADGVLWGIPINSAPHAVFLEHGFTPHWVPGRHAALWMRRTGYQRRWPRAQGVFVGGPGSRLDYGGGGASGYLAGRHRIHRTYPTQGDRNPHLPAGRVGHPILRPVAAMLPRIAEAAFLRGYRG